MKTLKRQTTLIFSLILIGIGLNGCVIDDENGYPGGGATTWQLCDHESLLCNYYGEVWEEYYEFYWHWANSLQNSIALNYPGGVVLYMDHVYINFDLFSCLLDGTFVTFRGE